MEKTSRQSHPAKHHDVQHFGRIKAQVEFYFGDSNLAKDRFMRHLIEQHPEGYVSVACIATFNRMKQLGASSVNTIVEALASSSLLTLSSDKTLVRRADLTLPAKSNYDHRTIYVEQLPIKADHDWIKGRFETYGAISHISLPRFTLGASAGRHKGYCFVEFGHESDMAAALNDHRHQQALSPPLRLWSKRDWLKLKKEYRQWLHSQTLAASKSLSSVAALDNTPSS